MKGRIPGNLNEWPVRLLRAAFFLLFLVAACDTELPIQPEESRFSEAGLSLSVDVINFTPTFIGRTAKCLVRVEYGDTVDMELILSTSDTTVFRVSPDSVHFSKRKGDAGIEVTYTPNVPDSLSLGYLYLVTYSWKDTLSLWPDTLGRDSLRLAGVGQGTYLDLEMLFIPGGTFLMGTDSIAAGNDFRYSNEVPAHEVTLSDFFIGRFEVTNIQYYEFWKEDPDGHTPRDTSIVGSWPDIAITKPNFPVIGVNWEDAMAFCRWMSMRTGERYTLPTEAQWEYTARGGGLREYPWSLVEGETPPEDTTGATTGQTSPMANVHHGGDGYTFEAPVDAFAPGAGAFGTYNIAGNVWEWCLDWFDPEYYRTEQMWNNPQGPDDPEHRVYKVVRGGSWLEPLEEARCANRSALNPDNREINAGFRVVRLP